MSDGEAAKELVKKIAFNTRLPYFTVTPTFSVCPEHGYIVGKHNTCPIALSATEQSTEQSADEQLALEQPIAEVRE